MPSELDRVIGHAPSGYIPETTPRYTSAGSDKASESIIEHSLVFYMLSEAHYGAEFP